MSKPSARKSLERLKSEQYRDLIRENASYDGGNQSPASDQTTLSSTEQGIVNDCVDILRTERVAAEERLADHKRTLMGGNGACDVRADRALKRLDNDIHHLKESETPHLMHLMKMRNERAVELQVFKSRHKINRPPDYPENRIWTVALLTVVLVLESVLNANMLAKTNLYGIVGGWAEAIFISLANIFFGFFTGLLPGRFIWYRKNPTVQSVAKWVLGFGIVFAIIFNFVFAHYRLTGSPELTGIMSKTLENIINRPLSVFLDIKSFALFIVGLAFCGLSGWKGFGWDDRYPMYGRIHRAWDKANQEVMGAQDAIRNRCRDIMAGIRKELSNNGRDALTRADRADSLEDVCLNEMNGFNGLAETVRSLMVQLLSEYRDINRKSRKTSAPAYFDTMPELPGKEIRLDCNLDKLRLDIEECNTRNKSVDSEVNRAIDMILDSEQEITSSLTAYFEELEKACESPAGQAGTEEDDFWDEAA
ncbi:hypothetical protein [Salidesulfovibrio brasiliensis]|uniref:hypothetical protein n=1 Tax=Salidesulfovibrio brasiliensis TaxID=221711 RepID=UPI0006D0F746|nr:hypothetical protein [Salidesulfovibrio brasiliensis]